MKALFLGLGSIGQRHLQNFKKLVPVESEVIAHRSSDKNLVIVDGTATQCHSLADYYNLKEYSSFSEAIEQAPDISFICNPSNLHLASAIRLAGIGSNLFIEKPVATAIKNFSILEDLVKEKMLTTLVGYQSRFHPELIKVKSIISKKEFGNIISARFTWNNYLPNFHSYENYSTSYAARSDLGGGVVFGLSHELDLIHWFFGLPSDVYAIKGGDSNLAVNVEDTVLALFNCQILNNNFPVSLSLSYAQGAERREFSILMENALLEIDLERRNFQIINHNKEMVLSENFKKLSRNDLFVSEMDNFLSSVINKKETKVPLSEGKKSLIMCLSVHKSLATGQVVRLKY